MLGYLDPSQISHLFLRILLLNFPVKPVGPVKQVRHYAQDDLHSIYFSKISGGCVLLDY